MSARVVVASARDSTDPATASGTAAGLSAAIEALGVEVVRVHGAPPRALERAATTMTRARWRLTRATGGAPSLGIETVLARDGLRRLRMRGVEADAVIALSSDFLIEGDVPVATYEDMTIRQAVAAGYADWRLPDRDLRWRIERQRRAYARAAACCTRSAWAAGSIVGDYGVDPAKVEVVGVGRNHETRPVERSWDPPRFLFVAADWRRKNGPLLLETFGRLRESVPAARLDVVGRHPEIDAPNVTAHGYLSLRDPAQRARLAALFDQATCFVLPSVHEPLGISHVEAGAAGIPSIGSAAGGAREIVGDGGTVVDPSSPDDLLRAMRHLADPQRAQAAGRRALERSRLYTWPLVARRMLAALGVPAAGGAP